MWRSLTPSRAPGRRGGGGGLYVATLFREPLRRGEGDRENGAVARPQRSIMAKKNVFVFLGAYASEADARADYDCQAAPHRGSGRHLRRGGGHQGRRRQRPRQQGRAAHPPRRLDGHRGRRRARHHLPPSIIGSAAVGGLAGGVIGHLWHGMSRSDVKDLGEGLDAGEAALIVIGDDKLADQLDQGRAPRDQGGQEADRRRRRRAQAPSSTRPRRSLGALARDKAGAGSPGARPSRPA